MKTEKSITTIIPISLTIIAIASEFLHLINDPFKGILIACVVAIIWLSYYLIKHLTVLKYSTKIFYARDQATPLMKKDISKYKHIAFIGISHITLDTYLQEAINENKKNVLPWESITVFFADDEVGKRWEKNAFDKNIRDSKIKISSVLFNEQNHKHLPHFNLLSFKQCRMPYSFGGCFCGNIQFGENNFSLEVIYSVNHLPVDTQTQKSWTIRVEQKAKSNEAHLFKELEASFSQIRTNSDDLGEIRFSVWEWSYSEWYNFATSYKGFTQGIDEMVSSLDFNNKKILDIGAGTGNVAKHVLKLFPKAKFTLMDDSANMLNIAKSVLDHKATYELFSFPLKTDYFIKKNPNEFDYIISHLSIQSVVSSKDDLTHLAIHCKNLLKKGGYMLVAVHNSHDVELKLAQNLNWNDTFRHDIEIEIQKKGLKLRNKNRELLREQDIIDVFVTKGFKELPKTTIEIDITMQDRKRLWEVPAVLDSIVNVKELGIIEGKKIVERAFSNNIMLTTPKRFLTVFKFKLINHND